MEIVNKMSIVYRIRYRKVGPLRYISHLDLNVLFRRLLRRTQLPVELTGGYNPRLKVSFGPALSLGIEGWEEILDLYLKGRMETKQIKEMINRQSPNGFMALQVDEIDETGNALSKSLRWAFYLVELILDPCLNNTNTNQSIKMIKHHISKFFNQKNILIQKQSIKGIKEIDLRPYIHKLEYRSQEQNHIIIRLIVDLQYKGSINPKFIVNSFLAHLGDDTIHLYRIIREKMVLEEK